MMQPCTIVSSLGKLIWFCGSFTARSKGRGNHIWTKKRKTEKSHRKNLKGGWRIKNGRTKRTAGPLTPMPARKNKKEAMARQGYKEAALRRQAKLNLPLNRGRGIYNWIKNEGREKEPENPKWRLRKPERKESSSSRAVDTLDCLQKTRKHWRQGHMKAALHRNAKLNLPLNVQI